MSWTDILGNVASGGLLGLVGQGVSTWLGILQQREKRAADRDAAAARLAEIKEMANANAQAAASALKHEQEKQAGEGFNASQAADANAHGASDWVQDVKALARPVLTVLLFLLTACYYAADTSVRAQIAQATISCATGAAFWWFGQRAATQFLHDRSQ